MSSNEETAEKFFEFCVSENLSKSRIDKHRHALRNICKWLEVGFKEATREDIERLVAKINLSDYADWTKRDHRKTLKKFYKWLEGEGEEFPKKVRWVKLGQINNKKTAEDMLTQEEVKRMIENASNIRDKAIISILYESGCRIGELVGLKIKSVVSKDSNLVHMQVSGKTGPRPIPLVSSVPYLSTWINNHPKRNDPEAQLFVSVGTKNNGKPIKKDVISKMLRIVASKANVKKKVNPHNFRHSRASYLANKLKEPQMRMFFGWAKGSNMPGEYVHLSGRDIDDAILEVNGIKKPEADASEKTLATKTCPRCNIVNEATATFCSKCMLPLTEQAMLEYEERMNELLGFLSKKEILQKLIEEKIEKKLREMGVN